jgi:hypothetical protein
MEAAADLGAPPWWVLVRVILPLSLPGILAGAALVFVPAIGEYVIPALLGGPEAQLIGKVLWGEVLRQSRLADGFSGRGLAGSGSGAGPRERSRARPPGRRIRRNVKTDTPSAAPECHHQHIAEARLGQIQRLDRRYPVHHSCVIHKGRVKWLS